MTKKLKISGRIWKINNSLVFTIPKDICEKHNIKEKDFVNIELVKWE